MATENANLPIWALPPPADRKPRYTRDQIAQAALRAADADGFEAVTMKRIAAELGAGTMTVYYYVRNKTDVVALMHDAILAESLIPADEFPGTWREALTALARRTREVMMAHPWSLASLNEAQFGPNAMRHFEQSLAAVAGTALAAPAKFELLGTVDDYVVGNAMHSIEALTRARIAAADPAMVTAAVEFGVAQLKTGDFPELTKLYTQSTESTQSTQAPDSAEVQDADAPGPAMTETALASQFERGLQALLDGLGARMKIE